MSKEPFRLTAWFGPHAPGREPGPPGEQHTDYGAIDLDEGGTAIPYAMEDPFIRAEYAETLKARRRREPHGPDMVRARRQGPLRRGVSVVTTTGGRIFFSSTGRTLALEDEIRLLSVGVDIGSSTSHLVFSRIVLERLDARYVVAAREAFYQSDILLTPYAAADDDRRRRARRLHRAPVSRPRASRADAIDTGALILTGVAVRRRNARAIGELFAREAGKLVAVSAGDGLETTMAAYGSGAVARSIRERAPRPQCRCRRRHRQDRAVRGRAASSR